MGFLEMDVDDVVEALEQWVPIPNASREKDFEEDLYRFLNEKFPSHVFQQQYKMGNTSADLFVEFRGGARVAVEVKASLTDRNEYHRLLGQAITYLREWKTEVVFVLCGACDPALTKLARDHIVFLNANTSKKARFVAKALTVGLQTIAILAGSNG